MKFKVGDIVTTKPGLKAVGHIVPNMTCQNWRYFKIKEISYAGYIYLEDYSFYYKEDDLQFAQEFKVGQKVRVRDDIEDSFNSSVEMDKMVGHTLTIEEFRFVYDRYTYLVEENSYYWDPDMIEAFGGRDVLNMIDEYVELAKEERCERMKEDQEDSINPTPVTMTASVIQKRINEKYFTPAKVDELVAIVQELEVRIEQTGITLDKLTKEKLDLKSILAELNSAVDRSDIKSVEQVTEEYAKFLEAEKKAFEAV